MCVQTGVTHFLTTVGGNRIVVALNIETSATHKHVTAYIDELRQRFKPPTDMSIIKGEIRKTYKKCIFLEDLPEIPTAHQIV